MKRLAGIIWVLIAVCVSTGCATIVNGSTQEMSLNTSPVGANVIIDGFPRGVTPVTLHLERGEDHDVTFSLDGYQPLTVKLYRKMSGWVWGNILIGGPIGVIVDVGTGAMYSLTPGVVNATLEQSIDVATLSGNGGFVITAMLLKDANGLRKIGQLEAAR